MMTEGRRQKAKVRKRIFNQLLRISKKVSEDEKVLLDQYKIINL